MAVAKAPRRGFGNSPKIRRQADLIFSDVVHETRVLVSRRLGDKNESLGLGLGSRSLGLGLGLEHLVLVLVLVSVLKKKSCSFSRLLL